MKICLIHNEYGKPSGEEMVVQAVHGLLKRSGHQVIPYIRSSVEIESRPFGKASAFFSGINSRKSKLEIRQILKEQNPDLVHIHNLYPFISPSILPECRQSGVPVVMTVHNYRLVCPNGLHMTKGEICEKCAGGREYWCILRNCERDLFKSTGYALRNWVARKKKYYLDNVTMYVTLTQFQRQRLIEEGFPPDRIAVIPNMSDVGKFEEHSGKGLYIGYIGRISPEKGIPTLMEAARQLPEIEFKAAGENHRMLHLPEQAPPNFKFLGQLDPIRLRDFYRSCRVLVLCNICFEGFPMVILEAMFYGKPVVCSRIGGISEIVDDGTTGLLFEPGDSEDLTEKVRYLWERPELMDKMGRAGRKKALAEFTPARYYERLMSVYNKTRELEQKRPFTFKLFQESA